VSVAERSEVSAPNTLHGSWLWTARAAWLAVVLSVLGTFVAGIPAVIEYYHTLCADECGFWQLDSGYVRTLSELGLSLDFYTAYMVTLDIIQTLGHGAIGALIFWRKSNDWMALLVSLTLILFGVDTLAKVAEAYPAWQLPIGSLTYLGEVLFFLSLSLFPNGCFIPRWTRVLVAVWAAYQLPYWLFPNSVFSGQTWPLLVDVPLTLSLFGALAYAQIYRYVRVSGPGERQQIKWVVYGLAMAIAAFIIIALVGVMFERLTQPGVPGVLFLLVGGTVIYAASLLIPLSIGIAILRYHLWDIDLIINRTLVYGSLSAVLAAVFAITDTLLLPLLVTAILGEDDATLNAVVSAVIIAVLFEPLRRRIKEGVKRLTDWLAGDDGMSESPR
jgi:hypothetical protein